MAPGDEVLSVEFKLNLLTPASAVRFEAVGRVVRAGRTLTVCAGEVRAAPGRGRRAGRPRGAHAGDHDRRADRPAAAGS
jgi:acyl-coenzyme A thioesterase PaaI-like protein